MINRKEDNDVITYDKSHWNESPNTRRTYSLWVVFNFAIVSVGITRVDGTKLGHTAITHANLR